MDIRTLITSTSLTLALVGGAIAFTAPKEAAGKDRVIRCHAMKPSCNPDLFKRRQDQGRKIKCPPGRICLR
jgi:hypothetical protein